MSSEEIVVELEEDPPAPEPSRVVVQVPAIDEPPEAFHAVLDGIANQEAPDHDVALEAWVTPVDDDETLAVARGHDAFEAVEAPEGKLTTRNAAHDAAIRDGADIVVTWDADASPAHRRVLAALLDPFQTGDVVATHGSPRAPWSNPVNVAVNVASKVEDVARPHVNSQLAAVTAYAWGEWGGFDESVDQHDVLAVRQHEEFAYHAALAELGRVVRVGQAVVLEEPRRPMHHLNRAMDRATLGRYSVGEWGEKRGSVSFQADEES